MIFNGVSDSFRPQVIVLPSYLHGKFMILTIGRLSAEKQQDLLIEVVILHSKYSDRIQLSFAGRGPKESKYRRLSKRLLNMLIFGFYSQEKLLELISASDLYGCGN
ncbi:MAG: glycosyltransferase [Syntrophomonas sp.]